jgi:hypothetical protein
MLQGLAISYWDLLFHREVATSAARCLFDEGILIASDKNLAISFFLNTPDNLTISSTYTGELVNDSFTPVSPVEVRAGYNNNISMNVHIKRSDEVSLFFNTVNKPSNIISVSNVTLEKLR